jgi:hypothetical protein
MSVDTSDVSAAVTRATPRKPARQPIGAPASRGGQFAPDMHDEDRIALEAIIEDRDAFWVPGTMHPAGGYDEIREEEGTGAVFYLLDGRLHREDGPAVELADGTEQYFYEGALHRDDDLPASVLSTGEREWYRYGAQHRDHDLPAVVHPDGTSIYIVDGKLHRGGGQPAVVYPSGHTEWWVDGGLHRDVRYGPAKIRSTGDDEFWVNGKRVSDPHRGV